MSQVYLDDNHDDLIWAEFTGPDWTAYNILLDNVEDELRKQGANVCVIFTPTVDLPQGSPMPHIQRFVKMVQTYPRFDLLIPVVPPWMKMAKVFVNIVLKFTSMQYQVTLVSNHEEAVKRYELYHDQKSVDSSS
jgi:hypothetical protein